MRRGLMLFLIIFSIDLYLMINISAAIGLSLVVLWLVFSSCFGIYLLRWQGLRAVKLARQIIEKRQLPENIFFTSMLVFCSGMLLIVPGLVTDFLGLVFLIPNVQSVSILLMQRKVRSWVNSFSGVRSTNNSFSSRPPTSSQVIEGELVEGDDKLR